MTITARFKTALFKMATLLGLLAVALAACAENKQARPSPVPASTMHEDVRKLGRDFSEVFARQDVDGVTAFYADDARILTPGIPLGEGKAAVRQVFQDLFALGGRTLTFETLDVLQGDDLVVEVGRSKLGLEPPGATPSIVPGKYVEVYKRRPDGGLEIVVDCGSSDVDQ